MHFSAIVVPSGACTRGPLFDITGLRRMPAIRAYPHTGGLQRPDETVTITPMSSAAIIAARLRSDICFLSFNSVPSRSMVISLIAIVFLHIGAAKPHISA